MTHSRAVTEVASFRWLGGLHLPGLLGAALLVGCQPPTVEETPPPPAKPPVLFELATNTGLEFEHRSGQFGRLLLPEVMGGGGGWIDYDRDGDLDLYLVQGQYLDPEWREGSPAAGDVLHDRLYRNELVSADPAVAGRLSFTDVTSQSGLTATSGYGMGVAVGDLNNDGWDDLYVTNLGSNQLWLNEGPGPDGTVSFRDATTVTGTDDPRWSTSAAFVDVDHDGWLDLYVVNYVDFEATSDKRCVTETGTPDYCGPRSYQPVTDRLWRNLGLDAQGEVHFEDLSASAGLLEVAGPGLGVVAGDFDGDGQIDLYVANDQAQNHLWLNPDGNGRLREVGLASGSALDSQGRAQASMGIDAGDIDGDGDLDLFMTHLIQEVNTLYLNDGRGLFADRSAATGVGPPSIATTGFGTGLLDVENDGDLDLVVVNGEVRQIPEQRDAGDPFPMKQPNQLFLSDGRNPPTFSDRSQGVPAFADSLVSRGAIVGDVDNDGDSDILVTNLEGRVQLLLNRTGNQAPWLGLELRGRSGRHLLGARAALRVGGQVLSTRWAHSDGGYLTARDPRVLFGLGRDRRPEGSGLEVRIQWPSGVCESWPGLEAGRYHPLTEGSGVSEAC